MSLSFDGAARDSCCCRCCCPLCVYEGGGGAGEGRKTASKRKRRRSRSGSPAVTLTPWQLILVRHEKTMLACRACLSCTWESR